MCLGFILERTSTLWALVLRHKAIAATTGTGAKLARYLSVAVWTGAGHSGNLLTALGTFNDAHIIYGTKGHRL